MDDSGRMGKGLGWVLLLGAMVGHAQTADARRVENPSPAGEEDLFAILNTPIISASKTEEKLSDAPATVIVLRKEDLRARGYSQLSQILDDLPGMQPNRPYGDYYVKNYWRGFRNTQGDPYLLMVDGLVMNSLYYNAVESTMITMPLAHVERIEVVYGPASAVYGSNAFMGVINVITAKDRKEEGSGQNVILTSGSQRMRVADAQFFHRKGDFRISVTARLEDSLLDAAASQDYEYSKNTYYLDRRLWGRLVDSPTLGGPHHSATEARALDLRAWWGTLEVGAFYQTLRSGYGNEYPADKVPNNAVWGRKHLSLFLRQATALSEALTGTTTLRYLETGITPDSFFVMAYPTNGVMGIDFQYYKVANNSWALHQDFEYRNSGALTVNFGLKYEKKDLQKAYELSPYYWKPVADFDPGAADFPRQLFDTPAWWNRVATEDSGLYLQGRWRLDAVHSLIGGGRWYHNSKFGDAKTLRFGYVGNWGRWNLKALYGQAYNEPTASSLYATWKGSGSDPNLDPERSTTMEVSGTYMDERFSVLGSLWHVRNSDTIVSKKNLGEQTFSGFDLHFRHLIRPLWSRNISVWIYYSRLLKNEGHNKNGAATGLTPDRAQVGDLARQQLKAGMTLDLGTWTATVLGRYVGRVETIASNPLGTLPSYSTLDVMLDWKSVFGVKGLSLGLKGANLLDRRYGHPGYDAADAGVKPGRWDGSTFSGSAGWYNSLMMQPGRSLQISLGITY